MYKCSIQDIYINTQKFYNIYEHNIVNITSINNVQNFSAEINIVTCMFNTEICLNSVAYDKFQCVDSAFILAAFVSCLFYDITFCVFSNK